MADQPTNKEVTRGVVEVVMNDKSNPGGTRGGEEDVSKRLKVTAAEVNTKTSSSSWASLFKDNRKLENGFKLREWKENERDILQEDLSSVEEAWGICMVGFILGRFPGRKAVDELRNSWGVKHQFYVHSSGWMVFKFESHEDREKVMANGPYNTYGTPWLIKSLPPLFKFGEECLSLIPTWIQLPGLPLECWNEKVLGKIVSHIGKLISSDQCTALRSRPAYARVLVEVDTNRPLVKEIKFGLPNGEQICQQVIFEHPPILCGLCKRIGHSTDACKKEEFRGRKRSLSRRPIRGAGPGDGKDNSGPNKNIKAMGRSGDKAVPVGASGVVKLVTEGESRLEKSVLVGTSRYVEKSVPGGESRLAEKSVKAGKLAPGGKSLVKRSVPVGESRLEDKSGAEKSQVGMEMSRVGEKSVADVPSQVVEKSGGEIPQVGMGMSRVVEKPVAVITERLLMSEGGNKGLLDKGKNKVEMVEELHEALAPCKGICEERQVTSSSNNRVEKSGADVRLQVAEIFKLPPIVVAEEHPEEEEESVGNATTSRSDTSPFLDMATEEELAELKEAGQKKKDKKKGKGKNKGRLRQK